MTKSLIELMNQLLTSGLSEEDIKMIREYIKEYKTD